MRQYFMNKIPVTIVSGFLGAGKTTIILNLIKQLPDSYNSVWLKNEYGDVNIDSELAKESNIKTTEILNGCLCCVLVGKVHGALLEIIKKNPDRIIIETAGTAYPYSIIMEVEKIPELKVDGVINIIDAVNFKGFQDKSMAAKLQAPFVDLIVINKALEAKEGDLDMRLDDVYELYPETPKIMTEDGFVNMDLLLGLDHKLINKDKVFNHIEEGHDHHHESDFEIETLSFVNEKNKFDLKKVEEVIKSFEKYELYRAKGIIKTEGGYYLLNYVFGKFKWELLEKYKGPTKVVIMGKGIRGLEFRI